MQPAPMTPETLSFIRSNAERMPAQSIADQLGWPIDRLQRTARDRQIALVASMPVEQAIRKPEPIASTAPKVAATPRPKLGIAASLDDIAGQLTGRQRRLFELLRNAQEPLTWQQIAADVRGSSSGISQVMRHIAARMIDTKYRIQCKAGRPTSSDDRGYHIVERWP